MAVVATSVVLLGACAENHGLTATRPDARPFAEARAECWAESMNIAGFGASGAESRGLRDMHGAERLGRICEGGRKSRPRVEPHRVLDYAQARQAPEGAMLDHTRGQAEYLCESAHEGDECRYPEPGKARLNGQ